MNSTRHDYRTYGGPRRPRRRRRSRRAIVLFTPGLLAVSLVALVGMAFAGSPEKIAPGVEIAGVDVGGLTEAEARQKLEKTSAKSAWRPAEFVAGGKTFKVVAAQLGVRADWKAAARNARRDGDGFGPLRGLTRLRMRFLGTDVAPPLNYSEDAVDHFLRNIARSVDVPALEPVLVLHGSEPSIVAGHRGKELNQKAATRLVVEALSSFSREPVALPVNVIAPSVSRTDLMRVADQAKTAISASVRLRLRDGRRWTISSAQLGKMLVYPRDGRRDLSIATDKTNAFLNNLSRQLNKPAKNATFAVSGRVVRLVPSRAGHVVDRESTADAILRSALRTTGRSALVAMQTSEPERTTEEAKEMGITGLVGSYETSFSGSFNRIHNVQLVAKLIDETLVAPGGVFSFNETTGERNSQKGFLEAPVIINGELTDGLGGGVCQVSTTTFNAAYEAGLPILERTNHALYISHYPLGRDATVNWPSTDLKFRNDTGHWLLIRSFASSSTLLVAIFGAPQHRRVESVAQPLHIDGAPPLKKILDPNLAKGRTIVEEYGEPSSSTNVRRRVYDSKGKLLYEATFYSRYRSTPKVVRVGTKPKKKKEPTTTTTTTTTDGTSSEEIPTDEPIAEPPAEEPPAEEPPA